MRANQLRAGIALVVVGTMACSEPRSLSALGSVWAQRLQLNIADRSPERASQTCEGIAGRFALDELSAFDNELLGQACTDARSGRWESAAQLLSDAGVPAVNAAPARVQPAQPTVPASAETIGVRGIELPLPEGAELLGHTKAPGQFGDDEWTVRFDGSEQSLRAFYTARLASSGWRVDRVMQQCFAKARAGSAEDELFCVRTGEEPGTYRLRLAP